MVRGMEWAAALWGWVSRWEALGVRSSVWAGAGGC